MILPRWLLPVAFLLFASTAARAQKSQKSLQSEIGRVHSRVLRVYESLHTNPERGHDQPKTRDLLRAALEQIGYTKFVQSESAPTAVIAILDTKRPGPTIALRAEMDALGGVTEPTSHAPRSLVPGVMHACGHDAHAAMLLGVADVLWNNQAALNGKIVFLFQPAEEVKGGADEIVADGILQQLGVQAIFSQHATAGAPVGTVSVAPGATLAGSTSFTISVTGASSHVAQPFAGGDAPQALSVIVAGLPDILARRIDVLSRPAVMSVSYLAAGDSTTVNRIAGTAIARGSLRSFESVTSSALGPPLATILDAYVTHTAAAHGAVGHISLRPGSPPLVNDSTLFRRIVPQLQSVWPGRIDTAPYRGMFAEDFAFYTPVVPSLYFGWGIAKDSLGNAGVHSSDFTIHPDAFDEGVRFFTILAELATTSRTALR